MNETFETWLARNRVDGDSLMQAARYYVAERTDDLDTADMLDEMATHTGQRAAVQAELGRLVGDTARMEAAALSVLRWAWNDADERPRVERAIDAAKKKLPVIEVTILGMVVLYGMYLEVTGGRKSVTTRTTDKGEKGGRVDETTTEYYPHPLKSLVDLFRARAKGDQDE
jgi:hypothetical protein